VYNAAGKKIPPVDMRLSLLPPLALAAATLAACGVTSQAERIDERTYRIESPRVMGGLTGPNKRLAEELCSRGYRVLQQDRDNDPYEGGTSIIWTVRCL
jgi:hypothetical protein